MTDQQPELNIYPYAEEREDGRVCIGLHIEAEDVSVKGKALDAGLHAYIKERMADLASSYGYEILTYGLEVWNGEVEPPALTPYVNGKTVGALANG